MAFQTIMATAEARLTRDAGGEAVSLENPGKAHNFDARWCASPDSAALSADWSET